MPDLLLSWEYRNNNHGAYPGKYLRALETHPPGSGKATGHLSGAYMPEIRLPVANKGRAIISGTSLAFLCPFPLKPLTKVWKKKKWNVSRSVVSDSQWPHGHYTARLLCPWNSPGKNTGVGSHSLLQGIFLTQGLNPGLPHCRQILYCLSNTRWEMDLHFGMNSSQWPSCVFKVDFLTAEWNRLDLVRV